MNQFVLSTLSTSILNMEKLKSEHINRANGYYVSIIQGIPKSLNLS